MRRNVPPITRSEQVLVAGRRFQTGLHERVGDNRRRKSHWHRPEHRGA